MLTLHLIFQQRDLAGELAVGVMRLVGADFRVADAALDDRLVDGIGLGGFLSHEAEKDENAFDGSEHIWCWLVSAVRWWVVKGSLLLCGRLFVFEQNLLLENVSELRVELRFVRSG